MHLLLYLEASLPSAAKLIEPTVMDQLLQAQLLPYLGLIPMHHLFVFSEIRGYTGTTEHSLEAIYLLKWNSPAFFRIPQQGAPAMEMINNDCHALNVIDENSYPTVSFGDANTERTQKACSLGIEGAI